MTNSIKVSSAGTKTVINASTPQNYYDGLSKQWAINDGIVQGQDYSSKYYAQKSKEEFTKAQTEVTKAQGASNEAKSYATLANGIIEDGKIAITELEQQAEINIENKKDELSLELKNEKTTYLNEVKSASQIAINTYSNVLTKNQITNCLLELPQTINLEIVDGELVLKKGSTFILPNGAGNFERITTTTDLKRASFSIGSYDEMYIQMHIPNSTGKAGLSFVLQNNVTVGTEQPTSGMWYNTNENKIVNYTSSGAENAIRSFPIAIVKTESGVVTEIKQVFNGLGHFGNCLFADKGIKGLIPNGRNKDGTLNNIEFETSKVITLIDVTGHTRENHDIILSATTLGIRSQLQYLKEENLLLNNVNGNIEKVCVVGKFSKTPTQYTGLNPKQTFRAVDWFEFSIVKKQLNTTTANVNNRYVVEKSPKSLLPSWWEVYSDGLIRQGGTIKKGSSIGSGGQWDSTVTLLKNYSDTDYRIFLAYGFGNTTGAAGQEFRYESKTISSFSASLYNRNSGTSMSADIELNWETQGY